MDMKLREYNPDQDFNTIKKWISDERTHALWCANRTDYPLNNKSFADLLEDVSVSCGDTPFVVTDEGNKPIGFFCYSLNKDTNEGMLKFVIVDPEKRGIGLGKEMIRRAVRYAFDTSKTERVRTTEHTFRQMKSEKVTEEQRYD